jgi:two-component system sensor histidine kinase MtrB
VRVGRASSHVGTGWSRWGLRRRVVTIFALLSLVLSLVLSVVAWVLVTNSVLRDQRASALAATSIDASQLDARLGVPGITVTTVLDELPRTLATAAIAEVGGRWYASAPTLGTSVLPDELVTLVDDQQAATQRVAVDGSLFLAVGLPVPGRQAALFELFPMDQTEQAVRALSIGLGSAMVVTVTLGVALGWRATRVALRPLERLNSAAADVAAGRLGVRLEHGGDPDLRPLTESFNRTVSALDHRVVADARFASDVSHELRTPLTTMLNSMQVILNRSDTLPASLREPVVILADELARFRRLVTDLLEIARYQAGDELVLDRAVVGDLVRRAADAEAGRPVTHVAEDAGRVTLDVDKRRLERVVANLVRNAEDHGGGCVAVRVERGAGGVRVLVDDAGPGVPPELRERVFDRFSRGAGSTAAGVGLGLSIVLRHVALHGGTVTIEDRPGGGARFVVELPTEPRG